MKLSSVVPWGRTMAEYRQMFSLTEYDCKQRIVGVGDGPASFNAEMTDLGYSVISVDPIYQFTAKTLKYRIEETYKTVLSQTRQHSDLYNWTVFRNADELGSRRMEAMNAFLVDYENGLNQGRYLAEQLPVLSFADNSFDLALCSHLLFLYSDQLSLTFHLDAISELLRIATEVRVFPLLMLNGQPSPYISVVQENCLANGVTVDIQTVDYHFQKGANQMMRLTSK